MWKHILRKERDLRNENSIFPKKEKFELKEMNKILIEFDR